MKTIESKVMIAFNSGTTWTLLGLFAYNGLTAIVPSLSGTLAILVNTALLVLAGYLHVGKVQSAAITGSTTTPKQQ